MDVDRADDEDHDHGREEHQDVSWLDEEEETSSCESADSEETLTNGVAVGGVGCGDASAFLAVLDELRGDGDLGTDVAELGCDTEEELVLLAESGVLVTGQVRALLGLECHVCICDFWDWREEEDNSEEEDEGGDTNISPLHLAEIVDVG